MTPRESKLAIEEFLGTGRVDDQTGGMALVDWMVHDRIFPSFGRTVMDEYLRRNASSLNDRERAFLESSARSYVDLFEVQEVREGTGVDVKSLTSGEVFLVHDISLSKVIARWDGMYGRVVNAERGLEFTGTALAVPRMHLDTVRERLKEEKRGSGLSWPEYLKRNWPSVRAQHGEILADWMDRLKVTNNDGEELEFSKATYRVLDRNVLLNSLRGSAKLHEEEEGKSFVWLSAEENGTLLGTISVVGGQLMLECNSRERFKGGKKPACRTSGCGVEVREGRCHYARRS